MLAATEVNSFFVGICATFPSITSSEIESLITEADTDDVGEIFEFAVYKELQKLNRKVASYPGEFPLREFAIFLSSIINQHFQEQMFPSAWKRVYVRVIPKVKSPKSCNQFRPISIDPTLSKVLETFIYRELISPISPCFG